MLALQPTPRPCRDRNPPHPPPPFYIFKAPNGVGCPRPSFTMPARCPRPNFPMARDARRCPHPSFTMPARCPRPTLPMPAAALAPICQCPQMPAPQFYHARAMPAPHFANAGLCREQPRKKVIENLRNFFSTPASYREGKIVSVDSLNSQSGPLPECVLRSHFG